MKRKNSDLKSLVNSLSAAEKRHFSLFSKAFAVKDSHSQYIHLFQRIESDSLELSEDDKLYSAQVIAKTKQRLYSNILKSLRIYYQEKSIDIIIQNLLSEVEILYKLGLAAQGMLLVSKAKELANTYEKFGLLLQILEWEKRLNIVIDIPSRPVDAIMKEERKVLDQLSQIMSLENIYAKIMALKRQFGYAKGKAQKQLELDTVKAQDMQALAGCLSSKAIFYYNLIYSVYHWMTFNHKSAYQYSKNLLHPGKVAIMPNDYLAALLQHITSSVCLGYFEDALQGIQLGEAYIEEYRLSQSPNFNSLMFAYHSTYELISYNYMGQRNKLREAIRTTEIRLKQFREVLSFELKQIIMGNLMNAYMGLGQIEEADEIWDSMFNKQSKTIRRDIYGDLFFFRLFSLLQSKTYVLLPSAALSASRYYRKFEDAKEVFDIELPIALLLSKKTDYEKQEQRSKVLHEIKKALVKSIKALSGGTNFQEHYTRYAIWIESLLSGKPFHEEAKKWYQEFKNKTNS